MRSTTTTPMLRRISVLMASCLLTVVATSAAAQYNYFPGDAAVDDGRTVALAGSNIETLAQDSLTFILAVPPGVDQFELGIFDGETGMVGAGGQRHWDNGSTQLQYALFYDPLMQGSSDPSNLVGVWRGNEANATSGVTWTSSSATFPDNDWWNLVVDVPEPPEPLPGQAPSGATFYHLCVSYRAANGAGLEDPCTGDLRPADASTQTIANFKIRATTNISVLSFAFAYEGALRVGTNADLGTIYPEWDGSIPPAGSTFWLTTPTTYDGTWTFNLDVPTTQEALRLFGGDFDFGTNPATLTTFPSQQALEPCFDNDDADTPNDAFFPPFAMGPGGVRLDDSLPEGARPFGSPADNSSADIFRREPCIMWMLTSPGPDHDLSTPADNVTYSNENPSSQREWEQFLIDTVAGCDTSPTCDPAISNCADYCEASALPAGVWRVDVAGVDLSNLNAWRSEQVSGFCLNCGELPRPYLVGDTVFEDVDQNGTQDPGEPGISGVVVELRDELGSVLASRVTGDPSSYPAGEWEACVARNTGADTPLDTAGLYCFDVSVANSDPDGTDSTTYGVYVADSNFEPGGALFDYFGTEPEASLPSPEQTNTVVEGGGNVMTYDFGYYALEVLGSVGDRVWYDADGDGVQDSGETGINGVTVTLYDADGNEVASQVTAGDGEYLFEGLTAGGYTVAVDASTLPAELAQTYDLDGLATRDRATFALGEGENRRDVDFGYDDCQPCDGKVTRLTLQYLGSSDAWVKVKAKQGSKLTYVFSAMLSPGDVFEVVGPADSRHGFSGTLGTEIKIYVDGAFHTMIHTSCSQPIGPGLVSGDFVVVSGESRNGGLLCPIDGGCTDCGGGDCPADLDFESDGAGQALPAGTVIDEEWSSLGIHVTTHDRSRHPAMIFDSSNPTGGDVDLGTPNEDFGGPGRGNGGESGRPFANTTAEGKVLIISEDGHHWDPDDDAGGGWILFTFDDPVSVASVSLIDIENSYSQVKAYDSDGSELVIKNIPATGDNGVVTVDVGATGVTYLKVWLKGSGAVSRIRFCEDDEGEDGGEDPPVVGTGTIGYWKTHPEAWPLSSVQLGPYVLSQQQGLDLLRSSPRGNMVIILAQQLLATKLNLAAGTEASCISGVVEAADEFIEDNPPSSWLSWWEKKQAEELKDKLDDYNNGKLCAPHRG